MEVEEGRGREDRRQERGKGLRCVRPRPWGSEVPLPCVLLPSILHFHLSSSPPPHLFLPSAFSSSQSSHGPEQASLSAAHQEIFSEALRWTAKYRGRTVGKQKTQKKHIRESVLGKNVFNRCTRALHVWNVCPGSPRLPRFSSECHVCEVWMSMSYFLHVFEFSSRQGKNLSDYFISNPEF